VTLAKVYSFETICYLLSTLLRFWTRVVRYLGWPVEPIQSDSLIDTIDHGPMSHHSVDASHEISKTSQILPSCLPLAGSTVLKHMQSCFRINSNW